MRPPIICPACAAKLQATDKMLGRKITCPMCGQQVILSRQPPIEPRTGRVDRARDHAATSPRPWPVALIAAGAAALVALVGVIAVAAFRFEPNDRPPKKTSIVAAVADRKDDDALEKKLGVMQKEIESLEKKNQSLEKTDELLKKENEAILHDEELLKRKIESAPKTSGRERTVPIPKVVRPADRPAEGLTITQFESPTKLKPQLPCMLWADAKVSAFLTLEAGTGVVRRVSYPDLKVTKQQDFDRPFSWMSLSSEGLLLTDSTADQIWLADPVTLAPLAKIDVPRLGRAASVPGLSVAIASDRLYGLLLNVVDLKKKVIVRGWADPNSISSREFRTNPLVNRGDSGPWPHYPDGNSAPTLENPVVSPNGVFVFTENNNPGGGMARFLLDNGKLHFKGYTWAFDYMSQSSRTVSAGITFSPDSKLVCRADFAGSIRGSANGTPIYGVTDDFTNHACILPVRPAPKAIGFDVKTGSIYVQNAKKGLTVYSLHGVEKEEFAPARPLDTVIQYLVHPAGGQFVALTTTGVSLVELPKRP